MPVVFFLAYFLLLIFVFFIGRLWKFRWDVKYYAILFFVASYVLTPLVYWWNMCGTGHVETIYLFDKSYVTHLWAFFIIMISCVVFCGVHRRKPSIIPVYTLHRNRLSKLLLFLLVVSAVSTFLFIQGQGGLMGAIRNTGAIRAGVFIEEEGHQGFLFFKRFIPIAEIVYFFYFVLPQKSRKEKFCQLCALLITLISLLALQGSRQGLFDFLVAHILVSLINTDKVYNKKLIALMCIAAVLLPYLKYFLGGGYALENNELDLSEKPSMSYFDEFSFAYYSLINAITYTGGYNFFSDFIDGIYSSFLPMSWKPSGLESTQILNTYLTRGIDGKSVPPGLIGEGYYSLGFIGVLIIIIFTTQTYNKLATICENIRLSFPRFAYVAAYFMLFSMAWIRTGLPKNLFYKPNFVIFILIIILCFKKTGHANRHTRQ